MTPEQQLSLMDGSNRPGARHSIPSGKIRLIVVSADQHWLARLERWWASFGKFSKVLWADRDI